MMTKDELKKFRATLVAKQTELQELVRNRNGIAVGSPRDPDDADEARRATDRELAIRNLDRESNLLRELRSAIRRIDEGGFGVCLECEEDINLKRLEALPWTRLCIQCQEKADRLQTGGDLGDLLPQGA
jgi:DnaK suppressor protein